MRRIPARVFAFVAFLLWTGLQPVLAQHEEHQVADESMVGTVHFETSCAADVQPAFNRAIALLHSFWFAAAIDGFGDVLEADPSCAMAEWGIAMAHWGNPLGSGRQPSMLADGWSAVQRARAIGASTQRERDYIAAVAKLYEDYEDTDDRTRGLAHEEAMRRLMETYPEDTEAAIFFSMALNGTADLNDKTYTKQLEAAEILERVFVEQPNHPGIAHYIIHSYDVPPLAERALEAARSYAAIAPAAPHALHMPSHTFTRLGYWQESIDTNMKSADAAVRADSPSEALHALDYMVYGYLQTGQDRAAKEVVDRMLELGAGVDDRSGYGTAGFYAMAAIAARYALERGDWAAAAALPTRRTPAPFVDAITYFARALGAARAGSPAAARVDLAELERARDALSRNDYWAQKVEIQRQVAEAWILLAEGQQAEALERMRAAADLEDTTEKSAISPGPVAPARELLGEMLLELNRPDAALVEFEATTVKEPGRFRGTYGAALAAELSGRDDLARTYYTALIEICERADAPGRSQLARARAFVG